MSGLENAAQLVSNDLIDIPEGNPFDIQQLGTDLVDHVIFMDKKGI